MLIDSHHHLWNLEQVHYPWLEARGTRRFFGDPTPIQKDYEADDFRGDWSGIPIRGSVHIQVGAAPGYEVAETIWLDQQASKTGLPSAIVAFADMTSANLALSLQDHLAASQRVRGIRHIVSRHAAEDTAQEGAALLRRSQFLANLHLLNQRDLSFDLQLTPPLLPVAADIFGHLPDLPVALCHAGSPWDQDVRSLREWEAGLRAFASLPKAVCKLSGLGMFNPDWTAETLRPIVEGVLQAFGPERVMWGSNFPVDKLYRSYEDLFKTVWNLVPDRDRQAVFGLNAARFYRLQLGREAG